MEVDIPRRLVWPAYLLMVCQGFLFYGIGYLTPYVETKLGAPVWASALPSTVMAVGLLAASVVVPRVVHVLGSWGAARLWAGMLAGSAVLIGLGASLPTLLVAAFVAGLAGAGALTHVVTAFAGREGGVLLVRATLASVAGGVVGPLVLSIAARDVGWNLGMLVPVPLALALVMLMPADRPGARAGVPDAPRAAAATKRLREPPLGRPYWLAWLFLVLCVGAESSFVAWGAQVAVRQTGIPLADATALGSLFILGEIIGRVGMGAGLGAATEAKRLLAGMVAGGVVGGLLIWLGPVAALSGAGLFTGGVALAGVWPTTAGLAVTNAPQSPVTAGARLNLAAGVAVLIGPLLLGIVSASTGVLGAWGIVLGLLLVALVVLRRVPARGTALPLPVPLDLARGGSAGPRGLPH